MTSSATSFLLIFYIPLIWESLILFPSSLIWHCFKVSLPSHQCIIVTEAALLLLMRNWCFITWQLYLGRSCEELQWGLWGSVDETIAGGGARLWDCGSSYRMKRVLSLSNRVPGDDASTRQSWLCDQSPVAFAFWRSKVKALWSACARIYARPGQLQPSQGALLQQACLSFLLSLIHKHNPIHFFVCLRWPLIPKSSSTFCSRPSSSTLVTAWNGYSCINNCFMSPLKTFQNSWCCVNASSS